MSGARAGKPVERCAIFDQDQQPTLVDIRESKAKETCKFSFDVDVDRSSRSNGKERRLTADIFRKIRDYDRWVFKTESVVSLLFSQNGITLLDKMCLKVTREWPLLRPLGHEPGRLLYLLVPVDLGREVERVRDRQPRDK